MLNTSIMFRVIQAMSLMISVKQQKSMTLRNHTNLRRKRSQALVSKLDAAQSA